MGTSTRGSEIAGFGPAEDAEGAAPIAGYGAPEPAEGASPTVDVGPEARRVRSGAGMRPAVAPDDVAAGDVRPDYGNKNLRKIIAMRPGERITTPEARDAIEARERRGDPIANDPLAGAIVAGIPAAGTAAAVTGGAAALGLPAWLARAAGGAAGGAQASPDHPIAGAALGAIPGLPGAAGAADRAIGRAALRQAIKPAVADTAAGKMIGSAVGSAVGHQIGGYPGAIVGAAIGAKAKEGVNMLGRRLVTALASRHLAKTAAGADGALVSEVAARYAAGTGTPPLTAANGGRAALLPAVPAGPAPPTEPPPMPPVGNSTPAAPAAAPETEDAFWRAAQREWGVTPLGSMKRGNHTTIGGATTVTKGDAGRLEQLQAEGAEVLGQLAKLRDAGTEMAPPELAQRARDIMQQIAALENTEVAASYGDKARAVAKLVKDARRGASKAELAKRAEKYGLDDEIAMKLAK